MDANPRRDCYLLIASVQKKHNIGNIVRSACAFGVKSILISGDKHECLDAANNALSDSSNTESANIKYNTFGAHGTDNFVDIKTFPRFRDAIDFLKQRNVAIIGIEITPNAKSIYSPDAFVDPVTSLPFPSVAFFPGSEGIGLVDAHKKVCDSFVYIPQYGNGTASLNVFAATSICLSMFGHAAGYAEAKRDPLNPEKFLVEKVQKRGATTEVDFEKQRMRALKKQKGDTVVPSNT
jgi:tRNA G18 (ribose-2'-O)-methylase SpoU